MISFEEWQATPWDKIRKDIKQISTEKRDRLLAALGGEWQIKAASLADENQRWTTTVEIEGEDIRGKARNDGDGKKYKVVSDLSHVVVNRLLVCFGTASQNTVKFTIKIFNPDDVSSSFEAEGHLALQGCESWHKARFTFTKQ